MPNDHFNRVHSFNRRLDPLRDRQRSQDSRDRSYNVLDWFAYNPFKLRQARGIDYSVKKPEPVEPIVYLLSLMMLAFAAIIIFCEFRFPMDGQIFQLFSGLLTGIAGAFLMRIKPKASASPDDDTDKDVTTTVTSTPKGKIPAPEVKING